MLCLLVFRPLSLSKRLLSSFKIRQTASVTFRAKPEKRPILSVKVTNWHLAFFVQIALKFGFLLCVDHTCSSLDTNTIIKEVSKNNSQKKHRASILSHLWNRMPESWFLAHWACRNERLICSLFQTTFLLYHIMYNYSFWTKTFQPSKKKTAVIRWFCLNYGGLKSCPTRIRT